MTAVRVKDRDGSEQTLDAAETTPLMETLRDDGYGIEGTCGGAMSCGTCHVYVSEAWAAKLPPPSEDEKAMLEAISDFAEVRPTSRLSCQILPDIIYDGLEVEIAPQA
ncbi:2Fe-2S iron-sulfur cluster-binding protein [Solimonas marina]|uniref:2Fe-2S iron-sulfur cluster binding domain-containing protein n=1 Tax=Solimonas marina TaxID=2714601 RepID=A0A969W7B7_9GAMM|nr:2Fe-2S iron-sulfur cluster-binding protein [Solimonas marina]NKF20854.1 2Fe-2S iron-sulfur cluster binding domain-containing protein [Solimonas marina]